MNKQHTVGLAMLLLGLCSVPACGGGQGEPDPGEATQALIAKLELENGLQVNYYAVGDGEIGVEAVADGADLEQVDSLREYAAAQADGLTAVQAYEHFAGCGAPSALLAAQARADEPRAAEGSDEVEAEVAEEIPEDVDIVPESTEELGEVTPLMSASNFTNTYCYKDTWSGYHSTSSRCYTNRSTTPFHTSSSRKRGTHATINTLNDRSVTVRHQARTALGEWGIDYARDQFTSRCSGYHICWSTLTGRNRYRRRVFMIPTNGARYHQWSALLARD